MRGGRGEQLRRKPELEVGLQKGRNFLRPSGAKWEVAEPGFVKPEANRILGLLFRRTLNYEYKTRLGSEYLLRKRNHNALQIFKN